MAKSKSLRLDNRHLDAVAEMQESGYADNDSEAVRAALDAGFTEFGVLNGGTHDTRLRKTARRFGDALALLTVFMVGVTFMYPVEFRVFVFGPLAASLGCYGLDKALSKREPAVSNWIRGLFSRGGAA